jgi:aminoglycoside phosphotransferase (APT) family kinase protein
MDTATLKSMVTKHCPDMGEDVEFRPIRTGKFNTSYFMNTPQKELVLRIAPPPDSEFVFYERDMMRQEPSIHSILREKTNVPVAEILAYDGSRSKVGRDYLIMERLPGRPMTEIGATADWQVPIRGTQHNRRSIRLSGTPPPHGTTVGLALGVPNDVGQTNRRHSTD